MNKISAIVTKLSEISGNVKAAIAGSVVLIVMISGMVKQCNENSRLRAELVHLENQQKIKENIEEIKDISEQIKPPTIEEIERQNAEAHSNDQDSKDVTF